MIHLMPEDRERGAVLIAACIIAAIRLRGEEIKPSPKLKHTIYESVELAVMVLRELKGRGSFNTN
jgi:hypothetical protein